MRVGQLLRVHLLLETHHKVKVTGRQVKVTGRGCQGHAGGDSRSRRGRVKVTQGVGQGHAGSTGDHAWGGSRSHGRHFQIARLKLDVVCAYSGITE